MRKIVNVAVLVSGGGTNLQAIIDFAGEGRLESGHIVKVISSKPSLRRRHPRRGRQGSRGNPLSSWGSGAPFP